MMAGCPARCAASRSGEAMLGDELVDPVEPFEMMAIELARRGGAYRREDAFSVAAEDRSVGHVGEAGDRQRSRPHASGEIAIGRRLRGDAGRAAMRVDIDGDGF